MKRNAKSYLHTVMVENYMLNKETGLAEKCNWILYSSPTTPAMARTLAENLKRVNKSYRIVENDGLPVDGKIIVVDQWCREGFVPEEN